VTKQNGNDAGTMEIERRAEQYPYIRPLKEVKHALQQFQNVMTTRAHRLYGK
jgi:hypothetical protein